MPVRAMLTEDLGALRGRFADYGQEHVFRFWAELDTSARERLARQAETVDLPTLARIRDATQEMLAPGGRELQPARIERLPERGGDPEARRQAQERGEELILRDHASANDCDIHGLAVRHVWGFDCGLRNSECGIESLWDGQRSLLDPDRGSPSG